MLFRSFLVGDALDLDISLDNFKFKKLDLRVSFNQLSLESFYFIRCFLELHKYTQIVRDSPNLIYLMHLSPPSSYSNKAFRNCVLSSSPDPVIRPIESAKTWLLPMLPSNTKTSLDTLKGCGKCLGYQPLKGLDMER